MVGGCAEGCLDRCGLFSLDGWLGGWIDGWEEGSYDIWLECWLDGCEGGCEGGCEDSSVDGYNMSWLGGSLDGRLKSGEEGSDRS